MKWRPTWGLSLMKTPINMSNEEKKEILSRLGGQYEDHQTLY